MVTESQPDIKGKQLKAVNLQSIIKLSSRNLSLENLEENLIIIGVEELRGKISLPEIVENIKLFGKPFFDFMGKSVISVGRNF